MGFQIVVNISKIKKTLQTDWPKTFSPTTWERGFEEIIFGRITEETTVYHLTPKKAHIDGFCFFKVHIADLF